MVEPLPFLPKPLINPLPHSPRCFFIYLPLTVTQAASRRRDNYFPLPLPCGSPPMSMEHSSFSMDTDLTLLEGATSCDQQVAVAAASDLPVDQHEPHARRPRFYEISDPSEVWECGGRSMVPRVRPSKPAVPPPASVLLNCNVMVLSNSRFLRSHTSGAGGPRGRAGCRRCIARYLGVWRRRRWRWAHHQWRQQRCPVCHAGGAAGA